MSVNNIKINYVLDLFFYFFMAVTAQSQSKPLAKKMDIETDSLKSKQKSTKEEPKKVCFYN